MSRRKETSGDEFDFSDVDEILGHEESDPSGSAHGRDAADVGEAGDDEDARDSAPAWDAGDERRQKDCFAPPQEPCECYCLHCGRTFMSDRIWFQRIIGDPMGLEGFWMCPTPNCDGAGFTFDIFPTDPAHPANEGWTTTDDDEDEEGEYFEVDDDDPDAPWDPDEAKYKELDEVFGDGDDYDTEGEEWKHGLAPGERPAEADWVEDARLQREEEEKRYDEPDERPRVLDWTHREDRKRVDTDDDIPF